MCKTTPCKMQFLFKTKQLSCKKEAAGATGWYMLRIFEHVSFSASVVMLP